MGLNYTIHKYMFGLPSSIPSSRWYKGLNCRVQSSEWAQVGHKLLFLSFFFSFKNGINLKKYDQTQKNGIKLKNGQLTMWAQFFGGNAVYKSLSEPK
jgi:hypothetical protein